MKKNPTFAEKKTISKLSFIHKLLIYKWGTGLVKRAQEGERRGRGRGGKTPQARISADLLFNVLAVPLIPHYSALKACSRCEEQKQIVLILCLVKQVVSTFKACAVWLKATRFRKGEEQERWREEKLDKRNTQLFVMFKIKSPLSCVFGFVAWMICGRMELQTIFGWQTNSTSVECEASAQQPTKQRGKQTSGAALWEKVWRTKNSSAGLLTATHCG